MKLFCTLCLVMKSEKGYQARKRIYVEVLRSECPQKKRFAGIK